MAKKELYIVLDDGTVGDDTVYDNLTDAMESVDPEDNVGVNVFTVYKLVPVRRFKQPKPSDGKWEVIK